MKKENPMQLNKKLLSLLIVALFACGNAPAAMAGNTSAAAQRDETEKIIHEYLVEHPEVIREAMRALQQREAAAEAETQKQALKSHHDELFADPQSPVLGNPDGDVTVVEFFDYRCGYCKHVEPSVEALLTNDKKVRLVLKEFPILGPDSVLATRAALAANKMGRYKEFHTALMAAGRVDETAIDALAARLGFDMARFHAERDSDATSAALEKNRKLADSLGIGGTPAFVVGERLIPGAADAATLADHVNAARLAHDTASK